MNIIEPFLLLRNYCETQRYKGWDPYDGLNSRVFQALPYFKHKAFWRLCVIQGFKRCPVNLRKLLGVPKGYNPKGIALFLQGFCNLYHAVDMNGALASVLGSKDELKDKVAELAELLVSLQSKGDFHGACWGYNFDWQARRLFLFPAYTPTVVVTSFCATALMDAYEVTGNRHYLDIAVSSAEFLLHDLSRHPVNGGFLLSYSPLKGNDTVYNASLLGCRLLSYCYHYTGKDVYRETAHQIVLACCNGQNDDGSWVYGLLPVQNWIDSFHTGYNLDSLMAYEELTGDTSFHKHLEMGFRFYLDHFFEQDGMPNYFHNKTYPIDIHCPGQLLVTLSRLNQLKEYRELADKVLGWTIDNMQDKEGFFYYQLKKGISSKISYMRWSNAFMFYALSYYILNR